MSESESKPSPGLYDGFGARFPRYARVVVLLLAIVVVLASFYFAQRSGVDPNAYGNDFSVYFFAASEVIHGRDPYQNSLGAWTPYLYPPLLAELLVPLALVPLPVAAYIWSLISIGSLVAAAWMSTALTNASSRMMVAVLAAFVVVRFALDNFDYGQVNVIVAALAVAHIFLYERNRKGWSMVAFVLAASIKLTPAILIFYHLGKRRFRFAAVCAAILIAVSALSFAPFGSAAPEAVQTFVQR
ncbi:MAG TPA: glycosyltransferase family 87 protein, partial [Blastocatellia bacterium]|nr:glycosyltransferase family 87 protein [Blastocatellia bacterium]